MASARKQKIAKITQGKAFRVISNTASTFILIVSIVICAIVVISAKSTTGAPNFLGYSFLSVRSGSMRPTFAMGDLIIVKRYDELERYTLKKGDVISFLTTTEDGERFINTHRIVEVNKDGSKVVSYTTQGDNAELPDEKHVKPANVLGRYTNKRIKGLGKAFEYAQTSKGVLFTVVIPAAIIVIWQLFNYLMFLSEKDPKHALRQAAAQPTPQIYPPAEVDKEAVIREYLEKQRQEERQRQQIIDEYLAKQKELEQAEKEKAEEAKIKAIIAEFLAQQQALGNDQNKHPDDPNNQNS